MPEGLPLLGRAGGEAVILARSGGGFFALGATCTHYSAPLADGIVTGGTLRCPWHHACFDLRTGEAVRAPAFSPVACYRVEVKGGRVRVGERQPEPPAKVSAAGGPSSVVIVGAGAAAYAAADTLRREGFRGRVTLIGAEETGPVDRPNLSKEFLTGKAPAAKRAVVVGAGFIGLEAAASLRELNAPSWLVPGDRERRVTGLVGAAA